MPEFQIYVGRVGERPSVLYGSVAEDIVDLVMPKIPICPKLLAHDLGIMLEIAANPTEENRRRLHQIGWDGVTYNPEEDSTKFNIGVYYIKFKPDGDSLWQ